jgi:predicted O-methyltransferase YrrM
MPPPLREIVAAVRYAPAGRRLALLRTLVPILFHRAAEPSIAPICEFDSIEKYRPCYARLAHLLGRPEQTPTPGEIEFLQQVCNRTIHYSGAIGSEEFFFLTAMASILAPARAIEIGTSSGFSAALLAAALHHRNPRSKEILVETIDLHPNYLVDRTKPIGFEIPDLVPDLAGAVAVHPRRESDFVSALAQPNELVLVFIDADHQHPSPLLDLLRVTPYIQSDGWIVLHDIQLGTMAATRPEKAPTLTHGAPFGAQWLFDCWPFAKISGGNIGAVQLPRDRRALLRSALALMARPFEVGAGSQRKFRKKLGLSLVELIE